MAATEDTTSIRTEFERLVADDLRRVRRAAVARYGFEVGTEAAADAQEWAWTHRDKVFVAHNRGGLLYRVMQSKARRHRRWSSRRAPVELLPEAVVDDWKPELVDLFHSLGRLSDEQRIAVVMVHAHGERYADVAGLLGVTEAAVTNHVHRGLVRLRKMLEANDER